MGEGTLAITVLLTFNKLKDITRRASLEESEAIEMVRLLPYEGAV